MRGCGRRGLCVALAGALAGPTGTVHAASPGRADARSADAGRGGVAVDAGHGAVAVDAGRGAGQPADAVVQPVDPDAGGPAQGVEAEPPELAPPPVAAWVQARRLAEAGRFAEAGAVFEAAHAETGDWRFLHAAALARGRAGQYARAVRLFDEVLARAAGLAGPARRFVEARRAEALARTVAVRLRAVEGPSAAPVAAEALARARLGLTGPPVAYGPPDMVDGTGVPGELRLDPGTWVVRLDVPGFAPAEVQRDAGSGEWVLELVRQAVEVELRFGPARALRRARMRLTADGRGETIEQAIAAPTVPVRLTTGSWRLVAWSARYRAEVPLAIDGPRAIAVELQRRPAEVAPRYSLAKKPLLGMLMTLPASYVVGVGLILGGSARENRVEERDEKLFAEAGVDPEAMVPPTPEQVAQVAAAYPTAEFHRDLRGASDLQTAGTVLGVFGVGTLGAVLPALLDKRRRAGVITLGVGAAVTAGGSGWMAWFLAQRAERLAADAPRVPDGDLLTGHLLGASLLLGIGLGLLVGSGAVLIADTVHRRRRARASAGPRVAPGVAGVAVGGRF
jgi:hypothetical protein